MSAEEWEDLVPFDIFDNNGDVYRTYITKKDKEVTDGNPAKTLRLLQSLKNLGQKPLGQWDESLGDSSNPTDISEWLPTVNRGPTTAAGLAKSGGAISKNVALSNNNISNPNRAIGKLGAVWPKHKTTIFLKTCLPYAEHLRCSIVPETYWQHISDVLYAKDCHELNYSAQQLREKMRVLKSYFNQTKKGKYGGTAWEFFTLMEVIFDKPIEGASISEQPSMSHGIDVYASNYRDKKVPLQNVEDSDNFLNSTPDFVRTSISVQHNEVNNNNGTVDMPILGLEITSHEASEHKEVNNNVTTDMPMISGLDIISEEEFSDVYSVSSCRKLIYNENHEASKHEEVNNNVTTDMPMISGLEITSEEEFSDVFSVSSCRKSINNESHEASKHKEVNNNGPTEPENISEELGVGYLDSESDSDIDILNSSTCSVEIAPAQDAASECTAARVVPFARNKERPKGINVCSPKMVWKCNQDTTSYSKFDLTGILASTPRKETLSSPCAKSFGAHAATSSLGSPTAKILASAENSLRSPAAKKNASGRAVYSPNKMKPPRTPKRKVAAVLLVWEPALTEKFVNACLRHRDDLKKESVPIGVWKEISAELHSDGYEKSWELIRAKFTNMKNYFSRSLKYGGMTSGIQWPHYKAFCAIHDIDSVVTDPDNDTEAERRKLWSPDRERLLFVLYADRKKLFDNTKCPIRHSTLYTEIASEMNVHDVPVTSKQCQDHMNKLIQDFNKAYDNANRTGGEAPTFDYYEEFLQIFEGSPCLEAPVCVSMGKGLSLTHDGKKVGESQSNSRTRTKSGMNAQQKKSYTYKTKISTPAPAPVTDRLADEVSRMTDIFDKASTEKIKLFSKLVGKLDRLKH